MGKGLPEVGSSRKVQGNLLRPGVCKKNLTWSVLILATKWCCWYKAVLVPSQNQGQKGLGHPRNGTGEGPQKVSHIVPVIRSHFLVICINLYLHTHDTASWKEVITSSVHFK